MSSSQRFSSATSTLGPPLTVFSKIGVRVREGVFADLFSAFQENSISSLSSKSVSFCLECEDVPLGQMKRNRLQRLVCLKEVASQRVLPYHSAWTESFYSVSSSVAVTEQFLP